MENQRCVNGSVDNHPRFGDACTDSFAELRRALLLYALTDVAGWRFPPPFSYATVGGLSDWQSAVDDLLSPQERAETWIEGEK